MVSKIKNIGRLVILMLAFGSVRSTHIDEQTQHHSSLAKAAIGKISYAIDGIRTFVRAYNNNFGHTPEEMEVFYQIRIALGMPIILYFMWCNPIRISDEGTLTIILPWHFWNTSLTDSSLITNDL